MALIMKEPTERTDRDLRRIKQDAENDWITMKNAARRDGREEDRIKEARIEMARELIMDGVDRYIISRTVGLSLEEIDELDE